MIEVSYKLDKQQKELLDIREKRQMYMLCSESKLHSMIGASICESELISLTKKYGICDVCDFSGLHISVSKRLLDRVVEVMYRYPRLRSRICFLGSRKGYLDLVDKLISADDAEIKSLGIQYIFSKENTRQIGQAIKELFDSQILKSDEVLLAQTILTGGAVDGIMIDDRVFGARDIRQAKIDLEKSVLVSHSPNGCDSIDGPIYHEIGHTLDFLCAVANDEQLLAEYNSLSALDIQNNLSGYATSSIREFIAEGFSEYMSSATPRTLAKHIVEAIDRCYQKLK